MADKTKTLAEIEREVIFEALKRNDYNKQATARELGVTPATIRNKLAKYGVVVMREVVVPIEDVVKDEQAFEPYGQKKSSRLRG